MESSTDREQLDVMYTPFMTRSADSVTQELEGLKLTPSLKKHFAPEVMAIAGKETTPLDLTLELLDTVDKYVRTRPPERRDEHLRRMIEHLSDYMRVLIGDEEVLTGTIARLEEVMAIPEIAHMISRYSVSDELPEEEPEDNIRVGAPKGIKAILDTPESERTTEQIRSLDKWLGRQALRGYGHRRRQPSQRRLARMTAEQSRSRGV